MCPQCHQVELYLLFTQGNWLRVQYRFLGPVLNFGSGMNENQSPSSAKIPNCHSQHCFSVASETQLRLKLYRNHISKVAVTSGGLKDMLSLALAAMAQLLNPELCTRIWIPGFF